MKICIQVVLFAVFMFPLGTEAQSKKATTSKSGWKVHKKSGYSISYPAAWIISEEAVMGTKFIITPASPSVADDFTENIMLHIQTVTGLELRDYTKFNIEQIQKLDNGKVLHSEYKQSPNGEMGIIEFSGKSGGKSLQWKQCYWVYDDQCYLLTYSGSQADYGKYVEAADEIMTSFRFKKK